MHGAAVERRELRRQSRDRDFRQGLWGPAALAMNHAHRPHMAIQRQFAGALMKHLAVDVGGLLGGEKDAERGDRVRPAARAESRPHRRSVEPVFLGPEQATDIPNR